MPRRFGIKTDRNADKVNGKIFPFIVTGKLFCKEIFICRVGYVGYLTAERIAF